MGKVPNEIERWVKFVWLIDEHTIGVKLAPRTDYPAFLDQVWVQIENIEGRKHLTRVSLVAKRRALGGPTMELAESAGKIFIEYPEDVNIRPGENCSGCDGILLEVDSEKIIEIIDEAGVRFPKIDADVREELEQSIRKLLTLDPEVTERFMWSYRGRFSRTHELALTHIRIDVYAQDLPPPRSKAVTFVQAFFMTQAEQSPT